MMMMMMTSSRCLSTNRRLRSTCCSRRRGCLWSGRRGQSFGTGTSDDRLLEREECRVFENGVVSTNRGRIFYTRIEVLDFDASSDRVDLEYECCGWYRSSGLLNTSDIGHCSTRRLRSVAHRFDVWTF